MGASSRALLLERSVQPIKNLVRVPKAQPFSDWGTANWSASGAAGQASTNTVVTSGGVTGGKFFRRAYTAVNTSSLNNSDIIQLNQGVFPGTTLGATCPVIPGRTYTISVWVRSSIAQTLKLQAQYVAGSGSALTAPSGPNVTLVPNVWTRMSFTSVASSNAAALRLDIDGGTTPTNWSIGDTMDADMAMITEGSTLYVYSDGDTPGWRWTGAVNLSQSIGWPYTLERLVGKPLGQITGAGALAVGALGLGPFEARTMYAVANRLSLSTAANAFAFLEPTSNYIRAGTGTDPYFMGRVQPSGAPTPLFLYEPHVTPVGMGAFALTVADQIASATFHSGLMADTTASVPGAPGGGISDGFKTQVQTTVAPVWAAVYRGAHSRTTRAQVLQWLATKYGFALAS